VFVKGLVNETIYSCVFRLHYNNTSSKCELSDMTFIKIKHAGQLVQYTKASNQLRIPAQNHRTTEVEQQLWRSSSPTAEEQGQTEQDAQDHIQLGFEYLQGWILHNLSGQSAPVFDFPYRKKIFSFV